MCPLSLSQWLVPEGGRNFPEDFFPSKRMELPRSKYYHGADNPKSGYSLSSTRFSSARFSALDALRACSRQIPHAPPLLTCIWYSFSAVGGLQQKSVCAFAIYKIKTVPPLFRCPPPYRNGSRISVANATLGLGAYWDLSAMCM